MTGAKRLILPVFLLMMMLSARMVYAQPPPAEADASAAAEAAECSEASGYSESAEYREDAPLPTAVPADEENAVSPAGTDNEEGMPAGSGDACGVAAAEELNAGGGSEDFVLVNTGSGEKSRGSEETEKTGLLIIYCNVRGSLGDLSRRFVYDLTLNGLEPDTEYEILNEDADLRRGFSGGGFESDSEGKALLQFCLGDENCLIIRDLPFGTAFDVCEKANDHTPEYIVHEVKSIKRSGSGPPGADLSTGEVKMTYSGGNYTVDFNNSRELAPVTGLPRHGPDTATTQLITGFALITVLIILYMKSRRMHIIIDMNTRDVLESSEQFTRSDIDGYKSRCDKYYCHKGRPDRCA